MYRGCFVNIVYCVCVIHNYQPERFEFIAANVLAGHQLVNVTCVWARVLVVSHMHGGRFIVFMRWYINAMLFHTQ